MPYICIAATLYDSLTDEQQTKLRAVGSHSGIVFGDGARMQDTDGNLWQVFSDERVDTKLAADGAALAVIMLSGGSVSLGNEQTDIQAWRSAHGVPTPNGGGNSVSDINAMIQAQGLTLSQAYASDGNELTHYDPTSALLDADSEVIVNE